MRSDFWSESVEIIRRMGPPMRPHPSEIGELRAWLVERIPDLAGRAAAADAPSTGRKTRTVDVLVLGVTVEIVTLAWPAGVRVTAAERAPGMIRAFWPGPAAGRRLVRADWDAMPFREASYDFVVGDGVFNTRHYPDGYRELGARIRALLRPGGCLFVRGFAQLDRPEQPDDVVAAYREGRIDDYHALRFRFLTSLQSSAADGIWATKEFIDQQLEARGVSLGELYRRTGYQPPPRREKSADQGAPRLRVSYPTLGEYERALAQQFRVLGRRHGVHPLAHRCPIYGLQRD